MSDWSEDTTLCFLEAYQNEPCIWNSKDTNHKNRQKVQDAWTCLSVIMKKNVKELKTKKEILMTTFRRHFKKQQESIRSGAGADDIYRPIWFEYDLMESFLGPVYTCTNNINTEEEVKIPTECAALAEEGKDLEDSDLGQPSTSQTPKPLTSRRRPATDTAERQMSSAFGQLTNILAKRQKENQPPPKEEDDCELYAKLLAKKLRELPPDDRKLMMYDIDTLFVNRIKEKQMRQTLSSYHSVPYQMQIASPMLKRPSTSQTSYTEPLPNTSPYLNRPSPSPTSYSEPTISYQPATSQMSHSESLPVKSPTQNQPSNSQTSILPNYITQPDYSTSTPTINIISNELIAPQTGQNLINQALLKAYEDFSYSEKLIILN